MKIIILGYTGLIGKNILEYLAEDKSLYLVCVARNIDNKPITNARIKYIKWDFKSFRKSDMLFLNQANIVINCVGKIINDQKSTQKINIIFIEKLLKYINTSKFKIRFIHLGSVSVYGINKYSIGHYKLISENSSTKSIDFYSKSKLEGDLLIQNNVKKNLNKCFSYTILRISNVFGGEKKSNLLKFIKLNLKYNFWVRSSKNILFNFINVKDVAQAVVLIISKLKVSKNKIYIVSDDCEQNLVYRKYEKVYKKKIKIINIPIGLIKIVVNYVPLPKKILNFFLIVSSKTSYSNKKIKKELKFKPKFSISRTLDF